MNQHYCFIVKSYFALSHKFRGMKNKMCQGPIGQPMGHSDCEATAVEMAIYSKFKINNKILFQNYMKKE